MTRIFTNLREQLIAWKGNFPEFFILIKRLQLFSLVVILSVAKNLRINAMDADSSASLGMTEGRGGLELFTND